MKEERGDTVPDVYLCPITKQPFRYPIFTSDGHRYELCALYEKLEKGVLYSPVTGELITYVQFDFRLKNDLDSMALPIRYKDYENDSLLTSLQTQLKPYHPWELELYKSNASALLFLSFILAYKALSRELITPNFVLAFLVYTAVADIGIRVVSNFRFGLFGAGMTALNNTISGGVLIAKACYALDPAEVHL